MAGLANTVEQKDTLGAGFLKRIKGRKRRQINIK